VVRYGSAMKIGRLEHLASRISRSFDLSLHFSHLSRFPRHVSLVDCTSLVVHPSLSVLHIHMLVTRYSLLNGGIITSKWYLWICVTNINLCITVKWICLKVNRTDFLAHLSPIFALGRVLLPRPETEVINNDYICESRYKKYTIR